MYVRRSQILAVALGALIGSAHGETLKLGYVDLKRLIDEAPQMEQRRRSIEAEFSERGQRLASDRARLIQLDAELDRDRPNLSPALKATREAEIEFLSKQIERADQALREEFQLRRDAELRQVESDLRAAVREIAQAEGYDLVLPSPVLYASPAVDITDRVLARLREDLEPTP